MDEIGQAIGDAVGGVFENPVVAVLVRLVAAYVVLVWLATALWAFVDVRRRTSNPIAPYGAAALIILASPVLFPFAVIVHRVLRPDLLVSDARLSELRDRALELEATRSRCPECDRVVEDDWLICPSCRRSLGHRCQRCGGTAGLEWSVCAWCGTSLEREGGRELRRA